MKTNEITAIEFSARFGTDKILPGSFSYFVSDNGVGVIKNNISRSIEVITAADIDLTEISMEDELLLMTLVCGEYKEEITIPKSDTIEDYKAREKAAQIKLNGIWIVFVIVITLTICILAYVYIYS